MTTAGSAATPGTIAHLRKLGYRVVATDIDPTAPGLYLADRGYIVPPGDTDDFVPELRGVCLKEGASAVIPLVDEELAAATDLEADGIAVLVPRRPFVTMCLDKYALMERLTASGVGTPVTRLASEWSGDLSFPLIVKPRSGRGSRGLAVATSEAELARILQMGPYSASDLILQEQLCGAEFTVSVVCWRDGDVQAVVPKEVILKRGVTKFAVTRQAPHIQELCEQIQRNLRADGPFNVQLALDAVGKPRVFEINPRFSSTTALTLASGVDEVGGLLSQALSGAGPVTAAWNPGVVMVRRWAEEFRTEAEFDAHGLHPNTTTFVPAP